MAPSMRQAFLDPLLNENPITLQILGLCSALAVTKTLATALIMSAAVTAVIMLSNASISLIRHHMPLLDHAFLLPRQPAKYIAHLFPDLPKDRLLPILRDEHDVILTLPSSVT